MNDRSARVAMLLGLAPFVSAAFWLGGVVGDVLGQDGMQTACLVGTVVLCAGTLRVWHRYVRWTGPRGISTAALTLLIIAQVVVWRPFFAAGGCGADDVLRFGQSSTLAGLWCVAAALIWWSNLLLSGQRRCAIHSLEVMHMSPNVVRLAMGMALLPLLPGLFFVTELALERFVGWKLYSSVFVAYELCAMVAMGVWIALWRRTVAWTRARWRRTLALAALMVIVPASVFVPDGWAPWSSTRADKLWNAIRDMLPLFVLAAWFAGTARAWRSERASPLEKADAELAQTVHCPQCGYSLVGLREVRCPECGWASTVDDVVQRAFADAID